MVSGLVDVGQVEEDHVAALVILPSGGEWPSTPPSCWWYAEARWSTCWCFTSLMWVTTIKAPNDGSSVHGLMVPVKLQPLRVLLGRCLSSGTEVVRRFWRTVWTRLQ